MRELKKNKQMKTVSQINGRERRKYDGSAGEIPHCVCYITTFQAPSLLSTS
jgi:hypothetical protein